MHIVNLKILFTFSIIIIFPLGKCDEQDINDLEENKRKKANEEVTANWEFEDGDGLDYPRGDKTKLREISKLWNEHYACLTQVATRARAPGHLPAVSETVFEGSVARLPCGLCVAPDERSYVTWMYSLSTDRQFSPLKAEQNVMVADNGNLTIYGTKPENSGVYRCEVGHSAGGPVFLAVVDSSESFDVVKPLSSGGPYPFPRATILAGTKQLTVFTSWSPWTECSVCDRVGRRRREGICYVNSFENIEETYDEQEDTTTASDMNQEQGLVNITVEEIFQDFPSGLPCRSPHLPANLRELSAIKNRRNEIMIGLCKINCQPESIFEVRTRRGLLELANNTEGVYSLRQKPPSPFSVPVATTLFVHLGSQLNITCPGISLRWIPLNWRVGTEDLDPRILDKDSGGRVHLNARDQIVFDGVLYSDANLYSCWQRDALVGTVKLSVTSTPATALLATAMCAAIALRLIARLLAHKQRRDK